ncbi:MAG: M28 family peptidase [Actinobacteria bacterium]|nr:M28 family peptidase [Actinomycetota bacterium]
MTLRRYLVIALLLVLPTTPPVSALSSGAATGAVEKFDRSKAMKHVWRLANRIGVRVRATDGEKRAARYIRRQFENLGYRVNVQKFAVDGGTSRNVVAWWPGVIEHPFVVGGHMDTVARSPGANDNASGVSILIETARLLRGRDKARLFKFVAFGSEEFGANGKHHVGSHVYVKRLGPRGRERSPGMVSVDMVGDGRPLIVGNSGIAGDVVAKELYRQLRDAKVSVRFDTWCDCSDHGPFEHAGIPASYMWSGDEPDYHAPSDTPWNMPTDDLYRSGRAVRAFVLSLSRSDLRRFRNSH